MIRECSICISNEDVKSIENFATDIDHGSIQSLQIKSTSLLLSRGTIKSTIFIVVNSNFLHSES